MIVVRSFYLFVLVILLASPAIADSPHESFTAANKLYRDGQFKEAAAG